MEKLGKVYPLLFTFRVLVPGPEFLAGVTASGAALMEYEEGAWWRHGVEPGGMTASGETPAGAYLRFSVAFREFLLDVAGSVESYDGFVQQVGDLFHQKDRSDEVRWREAIDAFRKGEDIAAPFSSLPKQPADSPRFVSIQRLNQTESFNAGDRMPDTPALPIAA